MTPAQRQALPATSTWYTPYPFGRSQRGENPYGKKFGTLVPSIRPSTLNFWKQEVDKANQERAFFGDPLIQNGLAAVPQTMTPQAPVGLKGGGFISQDASDRFDRSATHVGSTVKTQRIPLNGELDA